jgi:hypothetical protein
MNAQVRTADAKTVGDALSVPSAGTPFALPPLPYAEDALAPVTWRR